MKNSVFKVNDLSNNVNERFREIEPNNELEVDELIRFESSCRANLIRWVAKWDQNKNRPYFEGHESGDLVIEIEKFIDYFIKINLYIILLHQVLFYHGLFQLELNINKQTHEIRVLLAHDESTFKSGEIKSCRWIFPENAPFFSRGQMLSFFIVLHENETFFELNDNEWSVAAEMFPQLLNPESKLHYFERSASVWLQTGKDNYIDNDVVLDQFVRLFNLLKFKKVLSHTSIEIMVDNDGIILEAVQKFLKLKSFN
jgi:hypothetical protein